MDYSLIQIILAARNRDAEGWTNLLFIVVLAIFWALAGLAKARANKVKEQKRDKEQPQGPAIPHRSLRPQLKPPRRKVLRPQPVVQKFASKTQPPIQLPSIELPSIEPLQAPELATPAQIEEPTKLVGKAFGDLKERRAAIGSEAQPEEAIFEALLDFDDPDDLKRAILHYEILGKPLSLRSPSEHIR